MGLLGFASSAVWQGRRGATLLNCAVAGATGILIGLAVLILSGFSLAWVAAACVLLVGGVVMLAIGQVRRPLLALLAFVVPFHVGIHFFPLPGIHEGGPSEFTITPADVILVLLCFLGIAEASLRRRTRVRLFPAVLVPATLFIALGMVSSLNAGNPLLSAFQIVEFAKGLVFLLFVANTVRDEQDLKWALAGLMGAVLFQSSLGIYQAIVGRPLGLRMLGETNSAVRQLIGGRLSIRPVGTFWHTNQLGMFFGLALPVIGALLLVRIDPRMKLGAVLAVSLGLVTDGFTMSRGSWVGLLISTLLLLAFGFWRRILSGRLVFLGLTWLLLVFLAINLATNSVVILRLTSDDAGSAASRIPLMRGALTIVRDYPIFGSGLNNYQDTIRPYDVSGEFTETGYLPVVHNIFLLLAAETGLLGLIAFLCLLAALVWRGFRFSFRDQGSPILVATVVAGLLASEIHMIVENMVAVGLAGDTQLYIQFWFLAGLLLALTTWFGPGLTQARQSAEV
jgi:O-antigen ligase